MYAFGGRGIFVAFVDTGGGHIVAVLNFISLRMTQNGSEPLG